MPKTIIKSVFAGKIEIIRDTLTILEVPLTGNNVAVVFIVHPTLIDKRGLRIVINYQNDGILTDPLNQAIEALASETNITMKIMANKDTPEKVINNVQRILTQFNQRLRGLDLIEPEAKNFASNEFIESTKIKYSEGFQLDTNGHINESTKESVAFLPFSGFVK